MTLLLPEKTSTTIDTKIYEIGFIPIVYNTKKLNNKRYDVLLGKIEEKYQDKRIDCYNKNIIVFNDENYKYYCDHCKKYFNEIEGKSFYAKNTGEKIKQHKIDSIIFNINSLKQPTITCPHCKRQVLEKHVKSINSTYNTFNNYLVKDNKIILTRGFVNVDFKHSVFFKKSYKIFYVFNLETGQNYIIDNDTNNIRNITFGVNISNNDNMTYQYNHYSSKCQSINNVLKDIFNIIRKYKMNKYKYYIPTLYQQLFNSGSFFKDFFKFNTNTFFNSCLLFNRFPTLNIFNNNLLFSCIDRKKSKYVQKIYKIKDNCTNPIKELLSKCNVPYTKKSKELINSHQKLDFAVNMIKHDLDLKLIYSLIEYSNGTNNYFFLDNFQKVIDVLRKNPTYNEKRFIKACLKEKDKYCLNDFLIIYRKIVNSKPNYSLDLKNNIKMLHDIVTIDYERLQHENVEIEYTEEQLKINGTYNGYNFSLAKNTDELVLVGSEMSICVGTYRDKVLEHDCYIVTATDTENNHKLCIEIDKNFKKLKQTKLKHNIYPKEDSNILKAIYEFCDKNNFIPCNYEIASYESTKEYLKNHKIAI